MWAAESRSVDNHPPVENHARRPAAQARHQQTVLVAEPISDKAVVATLRPFVRASAPMLAALRDSDPLGLARKLLPDAPADDEDRDLDRGLLRKLAERLDTVKLPGTKRWAAMTVDDRVDWWIGRLGRFTALLAAVPGIGGALADRLPVQDALGAAGQGLLLCAIAIEHGVTDRAEQVRLLAAVLFDRDIDRDLADKRHDGEDARTAELTKDLDTGGKITVKAAARTLWRFGRALWAVTDELDKRPHGRFYHRLLGMLPVVGMAGDYFGERSGLKRAAKAARRWIAANQHV